MELRQYTLRQGQRDTLIELFDRELVESQEAVGIRVIGQFRDLDRPDRFVWLRGFADMDRRREALEAFYEGPVWKSHREAANATMLDVDDVLLLRPLTATSGFGPQPERPALGAVAPASVLVATICPLDGPLDVGMAEEALLPALAAMGAAPLAIFIDEPSENTFPALPVRTGEHIVVWIQRALASHAADEQGSRSASRRPWPALAGDLMRGLAAPPVQLWLEPTPRSRLR